MRGGGPTPVGEVFPSCLGGSGTIRKLELQVSGLWGDLVGSPARLHSRPLRLAGSTLWVAVSSAAWSQELGFLREQIRRRLCERLGTDAIAEIRFRVGEIAPPAREPLRAPTRAKPTADPAAIDEDLARVPDPELREAIRRAAVARARRRNIHEHSE